VRGWEENATTHLARDRERAVQGELGCSSSS